MNIAKEKAIRDWERRVEEIEKERAKKEAERKKAL